MSIVERALEYEFWGFSVLPCKPDKRPFVPWLPYQKKRATPEEIKAWWAKYPNANIGIITGSISGLSVIDIDEEQGDEEIKKYIDDFNVPTVLTPKGGKHYYFRSPKEKIGNNVRLIPGCDFRGENGYVIAPPSLNGNGKGWVWKEGFSLEDLALPELPQQYINAITNINTNNIYSYIRNSVSSNIAKKENLTLSNISNNFLQAGTRDNDLFHIANCLVKGNCEPEITEQVLNILADSCNPPFPKNEISIKIKSALDRAKRRERNLAEEVREYFTLHDGYTDLTSILQTLQVLTSQEKANFHVIIKRLVAEGVIEHYGEKRGVYRPVNQNIHKMNFIEGYVPEFDVKLPFGMNDILSIYPKNIIVVAGDKSAGKTAFLLNIAHMNQKKHQVVYLSSEMVAEEWSIRLKKWGIKKADEIKYQIEECATDFHARITEEPKIFIIDFLEIHDNFWEIGKIIRKIHDKLHDGICFVALQKKTNQQLGRGAEFSLEKSRLYLTLDFMPEERCSKLTIVDAKAPKLGESIRGYWKKIKIKDSIELLSDDNTWRK